MQTPRAGPLPPRGHAADPPRQPRRRLARRPARPRPERQHVYLLSRLDPALVEDLDMVPLGDPEELGRLSRRHDSCILLANAPQAVVCRPTRLGQIRTRSRKGTGGNRGNRGLGMHLCILCSFLFMPLFITIQRARKIGSDRQNGMQNRSPLPLLPPVPLPACSLPTCSRCTLDKTDKTGKHSTGTHRFRPVGEWTSRLTIVRASLEEAGTVLGIVASGPFS